MEIVGEEGKEEFKLQTSWRMIDSSFGREDGGGVVETATKNLKKLNLVLFTAIDPTSILPPGMRQIAHRQPSIHGTVSYQWRSSNSSEEQHTGTSQRSQFSHQQDSVLTGQSVYGYLWHSSWFSASHATFGKMYAALEATGR